MQSKSRAESQKSEKPVADTAIDRLPNTNSPSLPGFQCNCKGQSNWHPHISTFPLQGWRSAAVASPSLAEACDDQSWWHELPGIFHTGRCMHWQPLRPFPTHDLSHECAIDPGAPEETDRCNEAVLWKTYKDILVPVPSKINWTKDTDINRRLITPQTFPDMVWCLRLDPPLSAGDIPQLLCRQSPSLREECWQPSSLQTTWPSAGRQWCRVHFCGPWGQLAVFAGWIPAKCALAQKSIEWYPQIGNFYQELILNHEIEWRIKLMGKPTSNNMCLWDNPSIPILWCILAWVNLYLHRKSARLCVPWWSSSCSAMLCWMKPVREVWALRISSSCAPTMRKWWWSGSTQDVEQMG